MRRFHFISITIALILLLFASACGGQATPEPVTETEPEATTEAEPEAGEETAPEAGSEAEPEAEEEAAAGAEEEAEAEAGEEAEAPEPIFVEFDAGNFSDSTNIDNTWDPLQPGTKWVYEGITVEDEESIDHRIEFVVTDLTKEIAGVNTVVAWITDFSDDELVEAEIAFYAQDDDGNVWYLGEYPEEYEEGEFVAAPAWIAGVEDALPGVKMYADPQPGIPTYFQGWAPAVEWSDYGIISAVGEETCVPVDCYEDVLVIDESSLGEENAFQVKYYAQDVGNVRVGWKGEDATQEELELTEFTQLDADALAEAREAALALEEHAYEVSPDVYGTTAPSEEAAMAADEEAAAEAGEEAEAAEPVFVEFDAGNFSDSTNIDNIWDPLQPGTKWVYEGITVEDGESIDHRIEFVVTDLTKEIAGVNTVVAWITDFSDDELVEAEIAFYAQDDDGNVWYLGEYPEEYEEGEFVAAPTWIAGVEDALPGVKMYADPQPGIPTYFQGWAPAVEWSDYGIISAVGEETCVPVDCYEDVLVIDESSLDEENAFQVKYYAQDVGNVRVGWKGEDATQEELELTEFTQLDADALAEAREAALALEEHAYEVSPDVYGTTSPAE